MLASSFLSLSKTVRAVILDGERLLLCREKNGRLYYFPGWKLGAGEKSEDTLHRKIEEELAVRIRNYRYIGAMSNHFQVDKRRSHQEFELIYSVELSEKFKYADSGNVEFIWLSLGDFKNKKVFPEVMQRKITEWLNDSQVFWGSASHA